MLYSVIYSATGNNYPIPSSLEIFDLENDISAGLSHSFSELIRGRIDSAIDFNPHGPRVFLFFFLQLLMRPAFSFLFLRFHHETIWIILDAGISIILFVVAFWPFIQRLIEQVKTL